MFGKKDDYDDKDEGDWPTDDLEGEFEVEREFKTVEGYVEEYDE